MWAPPSERCRSSGGFKLFHHPTSSLEETSSTGGFRPLDVQYIKFSRLHSDLIQLLLAAYKHLRPWHTTLTSENQLRWRQTVAVPHISRVSAKKLRLNKPQSLQPAVRFVRSAPAWQEIPLYGYTQSIVFIKLFLFDSTLTNIGSSNGEYVWWKLQMAPADRQRRRIKEKLC